jgi:hypothetical protein
MGKGKSSWLEVATRVLPSGVLGVLGNRDMVEAGQLDERAECSPKSAVALLAVADSSGYFYEWAWAGREGEAQQCE